MTKKMAKLIEKYEFKLKLTLKIYGEKAQDFEKANKELNEVYKDFESLRNNGFLYGLINKKDFDETVHIANELYFEYYDKLLKLKYNK